MSTQTATPTAPGPMAALARMELLLLRRNWTAATLSAVTPLATGFLLARAHSDDPVSGVHGVAGAIGMAAAFSVHYHLTAVYASRRQDGVLKRLRSGVRGDRTILVGTALGGAVVFAAQAVLLVAFGVGVLGLPVPAQPWTLLVALGLGTAVLAGLSAALSGLTRSSEAALLTTLPTVSICLLTPGVLVPVAAVSGVPALIGSLMPLGAATALLRDGWLGTASAGSVSAPVGVLLAWLVVAVVAARRLVRWDPRQG
jgi:ABC-2 type transport system permease protein